MAKGDGSGAKRRTSCGVVVTDGALLLLGRFARRALWDIPKGVAEPGEDFAAAARRELWEETGLEAPPDALRNRSTMASLTLSAPKCVLSIPEPRPLNSTARLPDGSRCSAQSTACTPW